MGRVRRYTARVLTEARACHIRRRLGVPDWRVSPFVDRVRGARGSRVTQGLLGPSGLGLAELSRSCARVRAPTAVLSSGRPLPPFEMDSCDIGSSPTECRSRTTRTAAGLLGPASTRPDGMERPGFASIRVVQGGVERDGRDFPMRGDLVRQGISAAEQPTARADCPLPPIVHRTRI